MKGDHGLENGLGAASFEFADERLGLIGGSGDENAAAG
jgi:hypothetical protein